LLVQLFKLNPCPAKAAERSCAVSSISGLVFDLSVSIPAAATDLPRTVFCLALSREASQALDPSLNPLKVERLTDQLRGAPQDLPTGAIRLA
jgi:hypothetical protein